MFFFLTGKIKGNIFFEEAKMNYITSTKESLLAQDVLKRGQQS